MLLSARTINNDFVIPSDNLAWFIGYNVTWPRHKSETIFID